MKKKCSLILKTCVFCAAVFVCSGMSIFLAAYEIPDSTYCRAQLVDTWLLQKVELLENQEALPVQNRTDDYFLVRKEKENGELQIIFAPLVKQPIVLEDAQEKREELIETWPKDAPGAWILFRDEKTGKPLRVRYYIVPDSRVFVEFTPDTEKSYAYFYIFGAAAAYRVPVPVNFEWFYTASLKDVKRLTEYTLPWNYTKVFERSYEDNMQMIGVLRELLPAVNEASFFTGQTADVDFIKWIADGLVKPLTGSAIEDKTLKRSTALPLAEAQTADEYNAFDYIRNAAAAAISARTGILYYYNTSGADVKTEAFSLYRDNSGALKKTGFVADSGYPIELLKSLLYVLAVTEPGRFFLGAVRRSVPSTAAAGQSAEKQIFTGTAAFFPWFDASGTFQTAVFENGQEYTLDEYVQKNARCFVFLVRIKASKRFYPERPSVKEKSGE